MHFIMNDGANSENAGAGHQYGKLFRSEKPPYSVFIVGETSNGDAVRQEVKVA